MVCTAMHCPDCACYLLFPVHQQYVCLVIYYHVTKWNTVERALIILHQSSEA